MQFGVRLAGELPHRLCDVDCLAGRGECRPCLGSRWPARQSAPATRSNRSDELREPGPWSAVGGVIPIGGKDDTLQRHGTACAGHRSQHRVGADGPAQAVPMTGGGAAEELIPPPIGISAGSSTSPPGAMANRPCLGDADDVTSEVPCFVVETDDAGVGERPFFPHAHAGQHHRGPPSRPRRKGRHRDIRRPAIYRSRHNRSDHSAHREFPMSARLAIRRAP